MSSKIYQLLDRVSLRYLNSKSCNEFGCNRLEAVQIGMQARLLEQVLRFIYCSFHLP